MEKWGATFVSPWHDKPVGFEFAEALDTSMPMSYQVRRSQFDEILFRRAQGVVMEAREKCRVRDVDLGSGASPPRVTAVDADGTTHEWQPKFIVDATGRDTFLANRLKIKRRNPEHNSAALYGHFLGARRDPGKPGGNIMIFWFDHGWFWFIPLKDGSTSVGAVVWPYYMKRATSRCASTSWTRSRSARSGAPRGRGAMAEPTATGNYSYQCDSQGDNYILVGDAHLSSTRCSFGVMLAMNGGFAR